MIERVATLEANYNHLRKDLDEKHEQNRKSIHDMRNSQQDTNDKLDRTNKKIDNLRLNVAKWSGGAVVISYIAMHYVDKLFK